MSYKMEIITSTCASKLWRLIVKPITDNDPCDRNNLLITYSIRVTHIFSFLLLPPLILNYCHESLLLIVIAAVHFLSVSIQIDIESTSSELFVFLLPRLSLLISLSCHTR